MSKRKNKKRTGKKSGDETGHRQGKTLSTSHTTSIKEAGYLVDAVRKMNEVSKISLGIIKPVGGGTPRLKLSPIPAGIRAQVRGRTAVQIVFFYTSNQDKVSRELQKAFAKKAC